MQGFKRGRILAVMACLCLLFSLICQNVVYVFADVKPMTATVDFSESPYQKHIKTIEIKDIFAISDISVNTGKVDYEINKDEVKIIVSEGRPSRVGPHTKMVTIKEENSFDSFPKKVSYNTDGYIGDLDKTDTGYDSAKDLFWATYYGKATKAECYFYTYKVTYTYTLNVAPKMSLTAPTDEKELKDEITIEGFVKDENIGDELEVYYAFDSYTNTTKGTLYKSKLTSDATEQSIDGSIHIKTLNLKDGDHTLYMWAVDKRGEKSDVVETEIIVDTVAPDAPTLTQEPTSPTNEDVKVQIEYPKDAKVKEVKINDGDWVPFDDVAKGGEVVMDENGTVEARAKDEAGNVSDIESIEVTNIDRIPPQKPVIFQEPDNSISTNKDVEITIEYPKDADEKLYKVGDEVEWVKYDGKFKLSENDMVYAKCKDEAGNESEEASINVTNIDKIPPEAPILTKDITEPTNKSVSVDVYYPSDAAVKEISIDGSDWVPFDSVAVDDKIIMDENGVVEARAKDAAGNVSDIGSLTVDNIDKEAPDAPTIVPDNTDPTNDTVTVEVYYPDDAAVKEIKVGDGDWEPYVDPVVVDENTTVEARAEDEAGNESKADPKEITNIDKEAPQKPVISQDPDNSIATNKDVEITIEYPQDADEKLYKVGDDGDGAWIKYEDKFKLVENDRVYAKCKDEAGNESEVASINITNIDKIPPEAPTLAKDITEPTNKSVTVDVYYPDDAVVEEIRIDGSDWVPFDSVAVDDKIIMDKNGVVEARAEDQAGNVSDVGRLEIDNIDKTSPDTPKLVPDITEPTNGTVTVTVYYPNDPIIEEIKVGDGDWEPYIDPVAVDKNTTVEARSKDEAGNYSPVGECVIGNIDKIPPTAPEIITSADKTVEKPITATITPGIDEESGVDRTEYSLNGATVSDWQEYLDGSVIEIKNIGKTAISARTIDNAGNISTVTDKIVTIDEEQDDNNDDDNGGNSGGNNGNNDNGSSGGGDKDDKDKKDDKDDKDKRRVTEPNDNVGGVTGVDLSVFIKSDKAKYAEGDTITFTIDYKNKSNITSSNATIKAEIPEYTTVVDLAGGTVKEKTIEWKIEKISAKTSGAIEYKVNVEKLDKAEVSSSNTVTISSTNLANTQDDSSKTIFLLYSGAGNFHTKYIEGYTDNTFRPANNVTRAEVAAMMYNVLEIEKVEASDKKYTDVESTHWAYDCIKTVTNAGLFVGYGDGSFHPDSPITRAEFATVLANYLGFKNVEHDKINFSDISGHWAMNFIEEIYRVKLIEGYIENAERLFKPDNNISRCETVTIVNSMLFRGPLSGLEMPFKDVDEGHWAYGQILESALDHHFTRNDDDSEIAIIKD